MTSFQPIHEVHWGNGPEASLSEVRAAEGYCERLEAGQILALNHIPFPLAREDREFLLSRRFAEARFHKNISYRPREDRLHGYSSPVPEDGEQLRRIMRRYSEAITFFLGEFLTPYRHSWSLDYASFRP